MEQTPLYNATNFYLNPDRAFGTESLQPENTTTMNAALATLLCPSDVFRRLQDYSSSLNYLLATGTTYPLSPRNPSGVPTTGVYFENSAVSFAAIRDGTSQTVAVSETVKSDLMIGSQVWDGISPINGFVLTRGNDNVSNGPEITDYATQCTGAGLTLQNTRGSRWPYGAPGHTMYNHIRTPNDKGEDCRGGLPHSNRTNYWWDRLSDDVTARSRHPGGVNALACDGSVRFVKDTVNVSVWRGLGTIAGGEVISSDSY
jgi:prepilin-type processing-associated H-X9-DG protein